MSVLFAAVAAAGSLILQDPAPAPQIPPAAAATELDDVIVRQQRLEQAVRNFVDEVAAPTPGQGAARWDRRVCVGIANVRNPMAQQLVDRVSDVAMEIGLQPGEPGCKPNLLIIGSTDAGALARGLVEASPAAFRPNWTGSDRGGVALQRFIDTDAAVRWWHVGVPVNPDTNDVAVRISVDDAWAARKTFVRQPSRLRTNLRNRLERVFVIVDFDRAEGLALNQLGDYVAMVALAQIDPEAETEGFDSVLNLFRAPASVDGLTGWDRSYLTGLYGAELTSHSVAHQRDEVTHVMRRDRQAAGSTGDEAE